VTGDRWFGDETYYRAVDQFGQVIEVLVAEKRDMAATRGFFTRALEGGPCPTEITTDRQRDRIRSRTAEVPLGTDARGGPEAQTPGRESRFVSA
jgi:transposase-like protein